MNVTYTFKAFGKVSNNELIRKIILNRTINYRKSQ